MTAGMLAMILAMGMTACANADTKEKSTTKKEQVSESDEKKEQKMSDNEANGMNEKNMKKSRLAYIAGVYAFFQFLMPMIGWICVHTIVQVFGQFQKFIPWIALILLLYIGGSMIKESMQSEEEKEEVKRLSFAVLMMQGIATSIDALSVGFTTAGYGLVMAVVCSLIVAVVTFVICETGLCLGKTLGTKLSGKADVLGGVILIGIGIVSWGRGM